MGQVVPTKYLIQKRDRIVQLHRGGGSIRGIARHLGISRHQVARVLAAHQADRDAGSRGALPRPKQKRASSLDEHEASLAQLLQRYPNITAVCAHEELSKLGFEGGYGIVKRRLRESSTALGSIASNGNNRRKA